jgi:hypothetical protein
VILVTGNPGEADQILAAAQGGDRNLILRRQVTVGHKHFHVAVSVPPRPSLMV